MKLPKPPIRVIMAGGSSDDLSADMAALLEEESESLQIEVLKIRPRLYAIPHLMGTCHHDVVVIIGPIALDELISFGRLDPKPTLVHLPFPKDRIYKLFQGIQEGQGKWVRLDLPASTPETIVSEDIKPPRRRSRQTPMGISMSEPEERRSPMGFGNITD